MILEFTSALNTTLSVAASPRIIFPSVPPANVTTPTKNELPVTDNPAPTDSPAPTVKFLKLMLHQKLGMLHFPGHLKHYQ